MAGLTFTFSSPAPGLRHWDLRGPDGVVRFETADGLGLRTQSVYLHATSYLPCTDIGDCDVCGRGYHDALVSSLARRLRDEWEKSGEDDDVICQQLERWYRELFSSPVPVDEGLEVSGDEVGPSSGGLESGLEAATGADDIAVPSVPVAAHYQTAGWGGVPGECGVECACGTTFDNFDTIAEAAELLDEHIADANPATSVPVAAQAEPYGDLIIRRVEPRYFVEEAPPRTLLALEVLLATDDGGIYISRDIAYIGEDYEGNEVAYQVTGWDPRACALVIERRADLDRAILPHLSDDKLARGSGPLVVHNPDLEYGDRS